MKLKEHLVIMAKDPQPGQVKTRLMPALGAEGACKLYRAMLKDVVRNMMSPQWTVTLAITPWESRARFREEFGQEIELLEQKGSDLGERMIHVFRDLMSAQHAVVMRNSDSPDLPPEKIAEAFQYLGRPDVDVVFGPDYGGGYYLVGLKKPAPEIFRITMSTANNLETTQQKCRELNLKVATLTPHRDLDTPEDLEIFRQEMSEKSPLIAETARALKEMTS